MSRHVRAGHGPSERARTGSPACSRVPFRTRIGHPCFYCGLAVRLDGDADHPGRGVVEHVPVGRSRSPLPDLRLLHRFCRRSLDSKALRRALRCGVAIRRARLGRATERFDAGAPVLPHHDHLGLCPATLGNGELYRKHWLVRKMRYAMLACRYYGPAPSLDGPALLGEGPCSFD